MNTSSYIRTSILFSMSILGVLAHTVKGGESGLRQRSVAYIQQQACKPAVIGTCGLVSVSCAAHAFLKPSKYRAVEYMCAIGAGAFSLYGLCAKYGSAKHSDPEGSIVGTLQGDDGGWPEYTLWKQPTGAKIIWSLMQQSSRNDARKHICHLNDLERVNGTNYHVKTECNSFIFKHDDNLVGGSKCLKEVDILYFYNVQAGMTRYYYKEFNNHRQSSVRACTVAIDNLSSTLILYTMVVRSNGTWLCARSLDDEDMHCRIKLGGGGRFHDLESRKHSVAVLADDGSQQGTYALQQTQEGYTIALMSH